MVALWSASSTVRSHRTILGKWPQSLPHVRAKPNLLDSGQAGKSWLEVLSKRWETSKENLYLFAAEPSRHIQGMISCSLEILIQILCEAALQSPTLH
jgi:hypothetical protein